MAMPSPAPSTAGPTLVGLNPPNIPASSLMSAVDLSLSPSKLFDVDGMVVVVTGGGTGMIVNALHASDHCRANDKDYIY